MDEKIFQPVKRDYSGLAVDYAMEFNIAILVFTFPLIHTPLGGWFNTFWDSLLFLWVARKAFTKELRRWEMPPCGRLLLFFLGAVTLSLLFSGQLQMSLDRATYFAKGLALAVVSFDFFSRREQALRRIMILLLVTSVLVALDAIFQLIASTDVFGMPLSKTRATASFKHPFFLALWTGIGIFVAISQLAGASSKPLKVAFYVCIVLLSPAFILSQTRAAWLAMMMMMFFAFTYFSNKKDFLKVISLFFIVIVVSFTFSDALRMRALSILKADDLRWTIWNQTLALIANKFSHLNWFVGRGPGSFEMEYPAFDLIREGSMFPHMVALEIFYALGLLGTFIFCLWLICYIYRLMVLRKKPGQHFDDWCVGLIPLLILFTCFINESFFSRYFSFAFWFFTGLSLSLISKQNR